MSKPSHENVLDKLERILPTPKRVQRQNQSYRVVTNAKADGTTYNNALKVMFTPKWADFLNVNNILFDAVTTPDLNVNNVTLMVLKIFVQMLVHPLKKSLVFEFDDTNETLNYTAGTDDTNGDSLANAVYTFVALRSQIRIIQFRQNTLRKQLFFSATFTEPLEKVHEKLLEFLEPYFNKVNTQIMNCSYENVLPTLRSLQAVSEALKKFLSIGRILMDTQNQLFKECDIYLDKQQILQCPYLKDNVQKVVEEAQNVARYNLNVADRGMLNEVVKELQKLLVKSVKPEPTMSARPTAPRSAFPGLMDAFPGLMEDDEDKQRLKKVAIENFYKTWGYPDPVIDTNFEKHGLRFPTRICVVGRSGFGKTNAVLNLIYRTNPDPKNPFWKRLVVFSGATIEEPLYANLHKLYPKVELYNNIHAPQLQLVYGKSTKSSDSHKGPKEPKLIIFDDFIAMPDKDQALIRQYAYASRNLGWTCIFIAQKLMGDDGISSIIRDSTQYYCLFSIKNRNDLGRIKREIINVQQGDGFDTCFKEATKSKMNFLLVDKLVRGEGRYRQNFIGSCPNVHPLVEDSLINFYEQFGFQRPQRPNSWKNHFLMFPSRICIVGGSGCGKTNILINLIQRSGIMWHRIVIFNPIAVKQFLYLELEERIRSNTTKGKLELYSQINDSHLRLKNSDDPRKPKLIVFDDFIGMSKKDQALIRKYAIASRKFGWTCVFIGQKFANQAKLGIDKIIRDQCNYFILCPALDQSSIRFFKSSVDVDDEMFDNCYRIVNQSEVTILMAQEKIDNPFILVDQETEDPRLQIRIGFTTPCGEM
jgi:hypothetical protein